MRVWFSLLFFLTIGMCPFGYKIETLRVKNIDSCILTLSGEKNYVTWSDEVWEIGDIAEAIIRDDQIIEVKYKWR